MNLIDKINQFESLPSQTVGQFNRIFKNCQLKDLSPNLQVEIGEIADSDTVRFISVGSLIVKHRFVKDTEQLKEDNNE